MQDYFYHNKWGLIGVLSNYQDSIKDTKRTRGRYDRNVAPCSRPTTNVIGPLHECKKVCICTKDLGTPVKHSRMNQARSEEEEKRDRGKEADGKKDSPKNKNTSDDLKQGLPRNS